ncbi:MAG: Macrolide export ATP-binding/permease protein MacB [bacterium ADurb.Bin243]|nr:MAG: Macrolide export ATP-binding/permease protein MacB [bacterium ADurb.Bin243]HOD39518.1 ABC transporter permease [Candidatus Wallbacteria bacterium]
MDFVELIKLSLISLNANKMRSALTMLGVIIGVASVVAMISIGEGAKSLVTKSIESMGTNLLFIMPGQLRVGGGGHGMGSTQTLTYEDCEAIEKNCPSVYGCAPEISKSAKVKAGNQNTVTQIIGTTDRYPEVRNTKVAQGRYFTQLEMHTQKKVAVLGQSVVDNVFFNIDPIGKDILINRVYFTVIGVLEAKGQSGFMNVDDMIMIPVTTFQKRVFGINYLRNISVQVENASLMDQAEEEITDLLRKRHRILNPEDDDFSIRKQTEMLTHMNDITTTFTMLLGGIAFISLLVGGIGIMNIMLVSVTERTREIGLRKAIGAKKGDILKQFLIESIVLCVMGGTIGILTGISLSYMIAKFGNWSTTVSTASILLSFGFSIAVGLFFGIYPANKASGLNCVEALRYE